jgi:hypothetical protein
LERPALSRYACWVRISSSSTIWCGGEVIVITEPCVGNLYILVAAEEGDHLLRNLASTSGDPGWRLCGSCLIHRSRRGRSSGNETAKDDSRRQGW